MENNVQNPEMESGPDHHDSEVTPVNGFGISEKPSSIPQDPVLEESSLISEKPPPFSEESIPEKSVLEESSLITEKPPPFSEESIPDEPVSEESSFTSEKQPSFSEDSILEEPPAMSEVPTIVLGKPVLEEPLLTSKKAALIS